MVTRGPRRKGSQILVAMNPETAKQDMVELDTGGVAIYEESLNLKQYRSDVVCYPVPFDKITAAACPEAKLRKLVKNMVYVGVVSYILSLDLKVVEKWLAQAVRQEAEGLRPGTSAPWKAGYDSRAGKACRSRTPT